MSKLNVVEFLANLIFKKTVQKQSGIMKINPVDKFIAEKQAKSLIDKLKENKIDVNTLTQRDLNTMAEQIVNPLKNAEKVIPKKSADVIQFPKDRITDWTKARPTKELTHKDKIDWLVKNVDPKAEQTIPPKATLEAMLKDNRGDLIDHFFEMHTKKLGGKPQINIDTSDLKHPELVKKMMTDKKLKPTLVKTEAQIKSQIEKQNKEAIKRLKEKRTKEKMDDMKEFEDPEDLAGGGIAGMLGERTSYRVGKTAKKKKKKKRSLSMFEMMTMFPEMSFREPINFPYKSLEDIPENVLAMLKKDPNFDLETFLTKVAWSDPDKTRIQTKLKGDDEAWGLYNPMSDTSFLNYQQFGKSEPIGDGLLSIKSPSDADKVQTILHEMRHAKMKEPWFMKSSAIPKWVREYEERGEPHYLDKDIKDKHSQYRDTQKDVSGEELFVRFMDQHFGDVAEKGTIAGSYYKPYFDKILKDHWDPYAQRYKDIIEEEKRVKSKPYGLAGGGIAGMLGEPTYADENHRVPFKGGKKVLGSLAKLFDEFFPGTTKIGQRSKPYPEKVQEKMDLRKAFENFNNKIATQEALAKGSEKMAGAIKHKKTGPYDFLESTDATTWLQQEKFFNPKALDMYGNKVPSNWIEVEKKAAQKLIDDLGPLNVSPNHPNYKDMKAIRQSAKDRLESIKITEALGGNIQMHDWLRMNRKNINIDDYIKKPGAKKVDDELSGIKKAFIQRKLSPADELKAEFPGISDDLINKILTDDNPQRIAEVKAAMKEAMKMQEKGMGVEEILNIFKKEPTKHASGGIVDGRVGLLWGGGIYKAIIKNLAKEKGVNPSTYLKITNWKALPKDVQKYIPKDEFEKLKKSRIDMFENFVEMAKTRKNFLKSIEEGKKSSRHAAPIFEHLEKSFKSPVPSGVTDKDILQGEYILKNLKTKDRKLNASGGLAGMLGE